MPLITATRIRRASDGVVLAERLEEPLTPVRWAGAEPGEHTVYAEAQTAGGAVFRSADFAFDTALFKYRAGDDISQLGGTFSRASTGSYRDTDGIIRQAALNALRDAHYVRNPVTGLYERSTLLEGQRTNILLNNTGPSAFVGARWDHHGIAVTTQDDPRFGTVGTILNENTAAYNALSYFFDIGIEGDVARRVFLKKVNHRYIFITTGQPNSSYKKGIFDLDTGTWTQVSNPKVELEPIYHGDGWWEVGLVAPANATVNVYRSFRIGFSSVPQGVGVAISDGLVGGEAVQVALPTAEVASFPSSPIPTLGSPVTRAADSLDLSGIVWEAQTVTRYERRYSLQTGQWEEVYDVAERSGPVPLDLYHAYTHARYEPGTHPIEAMRTAAGAPNP